MHQLKKTQTYVKCGFGEVVVRYSDFDLNHVQYIEIRVNDITIELYHLGKKRRTHVRQGVFGECLGLRTGSGGVKGHNINILINTYDTGAVSVSGFVNGRVIDLEGIRVSTCIKC